MVNHLIVPRLALAILLSTTTIPAAPAMTLRSESEGRPAPPGLLAFAESGLRFEANEGQTDPRVRFLARGNGYTLFLTDAEVVLALSATAGGPAAARAVLRLQFRGMALRPMVRGYEELPGRSHYLLGGDPAHWRRDIPSFAQVRYSGVYPGIDLVLYGRQGHLEYDLVVGPGADPAAIRLGIEGAERRWLDDRGDILLQTSAGIVRLRRPVVYQDAAGARASIPGQYRLRGSDEIGFRIGAYDVRHPLVIDPVLTYATYLGGAGDDGSRTIALDAAGSLYVAGSTTSADFPTQHPFQSGLGGGSDAFVVKINPAGTALVYSTYLGGSGAEAINAIAVDASGSAYVTGATGSPNFPGSRPLQGTYGGGPNDAFVARLSPAGSDLIFSTYLGGRAVDLCNGIARDNSGNVYVSCRTGSDNLPATPGALQTVFHGIQDGFIAKLNARGSALIYLTYLGGSGDDFARRLVVDGAGRAHVVGRTSSMDFPTTTGVFQAALGGRVDAFAATLNAGGTALLHSTYLGGSLDDEGSGIGLDRVGNVYVAGWTGSSDFPTTARAFQRAYGGGPLDVFVAKLDAAGTFVYSTFLGGTGEDQSFFGFAVDRFGNAHVTGSTTSVDFPLKRPIQGVFGGGDGDIFVTKLAPNGSSLTYSTFVGGSGAEFSQGIAVDRSGNVYVSGASRSDNFPTVRPLQPHFAGGPYDVVVLKISDPVSFEMDVKGQGGP